MISLFVLILVIVGMLSALMMIGGLIWLVCFIAERWWSDQEFIVMLGFGDDD